LEVVCSSSEDKEDLPYRIWEKGTTAMSDEYDLQQIRVKAQEIVERAKTDQTFRQKVLADPVGILGEHGLSTRTILELKRERIEQALPTDCVDGTCIITICPETCVITIPWPVLKRTEPEA
jgi:hypothetical protein